MDGWTDEWKNHPKVMKDNQWQFMFSEQPHVALIVFGARAHRNPHTSARQHNQVLITQNRAQENIDWLEMPHNEETA